MNFNFRSRHTHISAGSLCLSLSHINSFSPCIIFPVSFRCVCDSLCSSATFSFLTYSPPSCLSASLPPSPFAAFSVLSHAFSLSVSFCFSLWSLSSWACLGGGLAAVSQAAVCCWSCATTEALWLTRYLFVQRNYRMHSLQGPLASESPEGAHIRNCTR